MNNPTDTNQASEDELHELLIKKLNTKKRMIEPHDERFVIGFQTKVPGDDVDWQYLDEVIMRFVKAYIRTEKLKLLAEVRERVVEEDEKPDGFSANRNSKKNLRPMYKNQLRAEQRIALTKLEAEL